MTLPGPSVPGPTDPRPSVPGPTLPGSPVPGPLKLAECSQIWKNQELTVQDLTVQEVSVQELTVQEVSCSHFDVPPFKPHCIKFAFYFHCQFVNRQYHSIFCTLHGVGNIVAAIRCRAGIKISVFVCTTELSCICLVYSNRIRFKY